MGEGPKPFQLNPWQALTVRVIQCSLFCYICDQCSTASMQMHKNPGLSQRLLPAASLQACIAPKMLAQDACDQQQMQWRGCDA